MTDPGQRVAAVLDEWTGGPYEYVSTSGTVQIESVAAGEQDGIPFVEVTVADPVGGDPRFRVFNPPALVPDPAGSVEVAGQRFRFDPVAALAETIGTAGGASARKGRAA